MAIPSPSFFFSGGVEEKRRVCEELGTKALPSVGSRAFPNEDGIFAPASDVGTGSSILLFSSCPTQLGGGVSEYHLQTSAPQFYKENVIVVVVGLFHNNGDNCRSLHVLLRICAFLESKREKKDEMRRAMQGIRLSPTYQNHRPVLHVFQFVHPSMLGLFPLDSHSDQIK